VGGVPTWKTAPVLPRLLKTLLSCPPDLLAKILYDAALGDDAEMLSVYEAGQIQVILAFVCRRAEEVNSKIQGALSARCSPVTSYRTAVDVPAGSGEPLLQNSQRDQFCLPKWRFREVLEMFR
jgi:hypothetical protein